MRSLLFPTGISNSFLAFLNPFNSVSIQMAVPKMCPSQRESSNPYHYNQYGVLVSVSARVSLQTGGRCTVQACDGQAAAGWLWLAGLDALPGLVSTLQMATIPLLRPRTPLTTQSTPTPTRRGLETTGARWSILAPSPSTTPATVEINQATHIQREPPSQPLHGLFALISNRDIPPACSLSS